MNIRTETEEGTRGYRVWLNDHPIFFATAMDAETYAEQLEQRINALPGMKFPPQQRSAE